MEFKKQVKIHSRNKSNLNIKLIISSLISISILILNGCGGESSGTDFKGVGKISESEVLTDKVINISSINQSHTLRPTENQEIRITGSNNIIKINTPPKTVTVTGNDNTIKIENKEKVKNFGNGNMILDLNGTVSNVN